MLHGSKRILLFDDAGQIKKIQNLFGSSLIGYWPGAEAGASPLPSALDYSGRSFHGAYTGVTLGQPGAGDGNTCPLYDGSTSYMQPPAGFRTAFTSAEYSFLLWFWPFNVGVWTDAAARVMIRVLVDANNTANIQKSSTNNTLQWQDIAGATVKTVTLATQSFLVPNHLGLTVSRSADQMKAYFNGAQTGATQTGLGTWVGIPIAANTLVGAGSTTPTFITNGYVAHAIVLNRAATPAEVAAAALL